MVHVYRASARVAHAGFRRHPNDRRPRVHLRPIEWPNNIHTLIYLFSKLLLRGVDGGGAPWRFGTPEASGGAASGSGGGGGGGGAGESTLS